MSVIIHEINASGVSKFSYDDFPEIITSSI